MLTPADRALGYERCYAILQEHGKTFYVMAKLFGPDRGRALAAVYGFCRTSDDIVDAADIQSGADVQKIRAQLDQVMQETRRAMRGESNAPQYAVLGETINQYKIELYPFEDLIAGVAMDLDKKRYQDYSELDLYCYRVAGTVGLMLLPIAGFEGGAHTIELAKTLGKAFQLTNILRDVGTDLKLGRIYLPHQELIQFGLTELDIEKHRRDELFQKFMDFQIDRAFAMYRKGLELIPFVKTWGGRISFQFAADAYSAIMTKIRKNDYDVYFKRAHLSTFEKLLIVPGSIARVLRAVVKHKIRGIFGEKHSVHS